MGDSDAGPRLADAIFNSEPMPRCLRAWHHVRWGLSHPFWALCFNVARLSRVRKYVLDATSVSDLSPMHRHLLLVTSPPDKLLDTLWKVIPRDSVGFPTVSPEFRGRVLSLVGSRDDYILWVRKDARWPDHWFAEEQEAGTGAWDTTPEGAVAAYFDYEGQPEKHHPPSSSGNEDICRNCGRERRDHKFTRGGAICLNGRRFESTVTRRV